MTVTNNNDINYAEAINAAPNGGLSPTKEKIMKNPCKHLSVGREGLNLTRRIVDGTIPLCENSDGSTIPCNPESGYCLLDLEIDVLSHQKRDALRKVKEFELYQK